MRKLSPQLKEIVYRLFAKATYTVALPWWKQVINFREFDIFTYTEEERNQQVEEALQKVEYPIVELCEWLLVNDIERAGNDTWKFDCGVEVTLTRVYGFGVEHKIKPNITNTTEEYNLLLECILESIENTHERSTEFNREKIGKYLEENDVE